MLARWQSQLASKRIILASGSPQRKRLLSQLNLELDVLPSTFEETLPKQQFNTAYEYAVKTAWHKAMDVANGISGSNGAADLIISADTVVEHEGEVLEKPENDQHAFAMLSKLSGSKHQVHTGVVLVLPDAADPGTGLKPLVREFWNTTDVEFDTLTADMINAYIATGEPKGKAGSYGIQGIAGSFVVRIEGCFFNVIGFPINQFARELSGLLQKGLLA